MGNSIHLNMGDRKYRSAPWNTSPQGQATEFHKKCQSCGRSFVAARFSGGQPPS